MAVFKNFNVLGKTKGDSVVSVTVTNQGSSYETVPLVAFAAAPAGGRTATGIAVLGVDGDADKVASIVITDGGKGYVGAPAVSFSGGGGSGAAGTAVITQASLGNVDIIRHTDGSWSWSVTINSVARTYKYRGTNSAINVLFKKLLVGPGGLAAKDSLFGTVREQVQV